VPLSSRFGIKNEQQPHRQSRRVDSAANRNKNSLYARILSFCASLLYSPTLSITYPPISPKISVHGCIHSSASSQTIHIQPLIQPSSFASFCWHATTARRSKNVLMLCLGLCRRTYGPWGHRSQHAYAVLARPRRCADTPLVPRIVNVRCRPRNVRCLRRCLQQRTLRCFCRLRTLLGWRPFAPPITVT
jgi:hypothetical protein